MSSTRPLFRWPEITADPPRGARVRGAQPETCTALDYGVMLKVSVSLEGSH